MRRRALAALLLALGLAASAAAQGGPGARGAGAARPREELFKMIDAYIVSNLQDSLGLSDEQFVKILPLVKRLQSDRRGFLERRHDMLQELRRQLESGRATEVRIGELLRELKTADNDEPAVVRKDMDAIDGQLTPVQQAKLRILQFEVEQKIRELVGRVRAGQGGRRNPGGKEQPEP